MSESRQQRRERERALAKVQKRALPLYTDTPTRQATRFRYAADLSTGTSPAQLLARAHDEGDAAAAGIFASAGSPACCEGCSYCCHLYVSVRAHEARALAAELRRLPAETLEGVRGRVAGNAARVRGSTSASYPRVACALLGSGGTCIAYAARPFSCRQYHSYDVEACRKVDVGEAAGVPSNVRAFSLQGEVASAFVEAVAAFGGDSGSYELQQALEILLRDPKGDLAPARE